MEKSKAYTWSIWGLVTILITRLVLLLALNNSINKLSVYHARIPEINIFSLLEIVLLVVVAIEAVVYFVFRFRIQSGPLIRLHVWSLFFVMSLMPAIPLFFVLIMPSYLGISDFTSVLILLNKVRFYLHWPLILAGHVAFVLTIIKSFKRNQNASSVEETSGILDEFIAD